jgi:hypothetical protein
MKMTEYNIFDISNVEQIDFEQMGTKSKFWYKDDAGDLFLFKATLSTDNLGNEIQRPGEDWAEKIACEIAKLLNIPSADYELAIYNNQQGVITKNFVANEENMQYGNSLLSAMCDVLDVVPLNFNHTHRLPEIAFCLGHYIKNKPKDWNSLPKIKTAQDVFSGYLMLDVLISNQDRHNENWGMISSKNNHPFLAPSFDHAASLGRNESDEKRELKLTSRDKGQSLASYVSRAKSQILTEDLKKIKTIDAFQKFSGAFAIEAAISWLEKLSLISNVEFRKIIDRVPESIMTDISKDFAFEILIENKKRLLDSLTLLQGVAKKNSNHE